MYVLFGTERTCSSAFGPWAFTRAYAAQSFVVGDSVVLLLEDRGATALRVRRMRWSAGEVYLRYLLS
jgi:hypothetical protein